MLRYPLTIAARNFAFGPAFVLRRRPLVIFDAAGRVVLTARSDPRWPPGEGITVCTAGDGPWVRLRAGPVRDDKRGYLLTTPGGAAVGSLPRLLGRSAPLADARGAEVGRIEQTRPASLLFANGLLRGVPIVGALLDARFGNVYAVELRGQRVLTLTQRPAVLWIRFTVERQGAFGAEEERLLLGALLGVLIADRI